MATEGTFVLADIGGYTKFLTGVGIQHAKETTEHILNRLIKSAGGRWKVANIMGDCVFFYSEGKEAPDETFRKLRAMHETFQETQLDIASGSSCRCGACDRTEDLSLKFVVHAGEFDVQKIGGRRELIGPDVVVATRLLKNSVPLREYVIATPAAVAVAEASGIPPQQATDHLESIGPVEYTYIDLEPVRRAFREALEFYITLQDADVVLKEDISAPASVVWDAISRLEKRALWQVTISKMEHLQGPENGLGEVHSCVHNNSKMVHATTAIDQVNMQKTERVWISPPIMKDVYVTMQAIATGTDRARCEFRTTFKPGIPIISTLIRPIYIRMVMSDIKKDMAGLKELCETGRVASRKAAAA